MSDAELISAYLAHAKTLRRLGLEQHPFGPPDAARHATRRRTAPVTSSAIVDDFQARVPNLVAPGTLVHAARRIAHGTAWRDRGGRDAMGDNLRVSTGERRLVDQTGISWNHMQTWLRRLATLAASM
jgi:hypothetical protein